jgi:hypothetical protein
MGFTKNIVCSFKSHVLEHWQERITIVIATFTPNKLSWVHTVIAHHFDVYQMTNGTCIKFYKN